MNYERHYHFERPSVIARAVVVFAVAALLGAGIYLLLARPHVEIVLKNDLSSNPPGLRVEVRANALAHRFDLPRLSASAPLHDGRGTIRLGANDLPPGRSEIAYVLREPWYLPDRHGSVSVDRPSRPVDYVLRVAPDDAGGARLSVSGDRGNHVLVIDPAGKVVLSGRLTEMADDTGAATVTFSKEDLASFQGEGPLTAQVSVTSPAGDVDKRTVTLVEKPTAKGASRVLFPPPGTVTDRSIVRVRVITEPDASVRFGEDPEGKPGPRVEYDWRLGREGTNTLTFETRAPGLAPARGTIEVKRVVEAAAPEEAPASETIVDTVPYAELSDHPEAYAGRRVKIAGVIAAPPAGSGSSGLAEVSSGEETMKGEIAITYDSEKTPPLQKGDRVIVHGVVQGSQRLRTAAGWTLAVPKARADRIDLAALADEPAHFNVSYARIRAAFWHAPAPGARPGKAPSPPDDVLASVEPWPEPPPAQQAARIARVEIVSGRGDLAAAPPLPSLRPTPSEANVQGGPSNPSPENAAPSPGPAPVPEKTETSAASRDQEAMTTAPTPNAPAKPAGWARDRELESELAGRGVTGVQILRKGRSIRLRGTVGSDKALRSVYQFMNDKEFGEVEYHVEVR